MINTFFKHVYLFLAGVVFGAAAVTTNVLIQNLLGISVTRLSSDPFIIPLLLKVFTTLLAGAIFEEIVCRQLLLTFLLNIFSRKWNAIICGSILFSIAHVFNDHFTIVAFFSHFLGGIAYSMAFIHSGKLWLPIGLHLGWNYFQSGVLGMPVSGKTYYGIWNTTFIGEDIWTGGNYGLEGGLLGLIARGFVIICLILFFKYSLSKSNSKVLTEENSRIGGSALE